MHCLMQGQCSRCNTCSTWCGPHRVCRTSWACAWMVSTAANEENSGMPFLHHQSCLAGKTNQCHSSRMKALQNRNCTREQSILLMMMFNEAFAPKKRLGTQCSVSLLHCSLKLLWLLLQNGWNTSGLVGIWHTLVNMVNFADLLLHICYITILSRGLKNLTAAGGALTLWQQPSVIAISGLVLAYLMAQWLPQQQCSQHMQSAT